jgi:DNA-binding NarL/FixJ family response regulator
MKTNPPSILKEAIRRVIAGELFFSEKILKRIQKKKSGRSPGPATLLDTLSNREMDVFRLIGEGLDTVNISKKLSISRNTVDTHRINIKNKLSLENGKALDRMAFEVLKQGKLPKQ